MNKLLRNSTVIASGAIVAAILAPVLARGVAPAPSPGFAPNDACVGNARVLIYAVNAYAQDNDTKLPPTDTVAHFDAALTPYVPGASIFACPATHLLYTPNPAIGGHSLVEYRATAGSVVVFQDAQPHADHKSTVAFLDGHIERGGIEAGNPEAICIARVRAILLAISQYTQDNNDQFPPLDTASHAQAALAPYTASPRIFTCPATGQPYEFNSSLSYVSYSSISSPSTTIVVQDSAPHSDTFRTIGYADRHITHGPPTTAYLSGRNVQNLRLLGYGALQYTFGNNDQKLPPLQNEQSFEAAILPYVRKQSPFVNPMTGENYSLNAAYSGIYYPQIANPSQVWLVKDRATNFDGTFSILYADFRATTHYYFVPAHISVGVNNETRLVWSGADGTAAISRISASGAELGRRDLGAGFGAVRGVTTSPSGTTSILFSPASVLTFNSGYAQTQFVHYGPYDGWGAYSIAIGGDGIARTLWRRYDKSWAIWRNTAAGEYASDVRFGPFPGIDGAGLAAGADNAMSVYWKRPSGEAVLWRLSPSAVPQSYRTIPALGSRQPVAITISPDNNTWLLLDRGDGGATVYAFNAQLAVVYRLEFNPEAGWTAKDLGVGADGNVRILWNDMHGNGRLRIVTPSGTVVSSHDLAAY